MDNPWVVWPAGIFLWLLITALLFAYFERRYWNRLTLSRFTYEVTKAFPLLIFLIGLAVGYLTGALSVHFWWHWCPDPNISVG